MRFLANVGLAPIPAGPDANTSYIGGSHFSVFKDAKRPRWSLEARSVALGCRDAREVVRVLRDLPPSQSAWEGDALASDPNLAVFGEQLQNAQNAPAVTTWTQVGLSSTARPRRWQRA